MDIELPGRLAATAYRLAASAELVLLRRIARSLAVGIDGPQWAQRQLSLVRPLTAALAREVESFTGQARTAVTDAVLRAGESGTATARAELLGALSRSPSNMPAGSAALLALAEEASGQVASTQQGILRMAMDAYRLVVSDASAANLLGAATRRQVAQTAFDRFLARGITGFVDASGRRWELASYVEMATRTAAQRAMTQAHTQELTRQGIDLVMVSDAPQECAVCRPFEGKVLSLTGSGRADLMMPSATTGKMVTVHVAGGLDEAKRAGLYHPGCRHSHSAYLPGLTKTPRAVTADPQGDAARQRLRELERRLRRWKRTEVGALDDVAAARARARVRMVQAQIRDHVANTSAKRQSAREQIGVAR